MWIDNGGDENEFKLKDRVKMLQLYGMIGLFSRLFDQNSRDIIFFSVLHSSFIIYETKLSLLI